MLWYIEQNQRGTGNSMKVLRILGTLLVIFVCIIGVAFLVMSKQQNDALAKLTDVPIDMAKVADGIYTAESEAALIKVRVQVTVKNHAIENIQLLKHENGLGKAAEAMLPEMVKENTDIVDTVSGATASSLTIRNAVNQALRQGLVK